MSVVFWLKKTKLSGTLEKVYSQKICWTLFWIFVKKKVCLEFLIFLWRGKGQETNCFNRLNLSILKWDRSREIYTGESPLSHSSQSCQAGCLPIDCIILVLFCQNYFPHMIVNCKSLVSARGIPSSTSKPVKVQSIANSKGSLQHVCLKEVPKLTLRS